MKANEIKDNSSSANRTECFSPVSLAQTRNALGKKISCSSTAGWSSLLVQAWDKPADCGAFETLPSPDQLIAINLAGEHEIESFSNGVWRKALSHPGTGGLTAAGKVDRLRWRATSFGQHKMLFIHIPQFFFEQAAEEYQRAGVAFRLDALDALSFRDPVVFQTALALNEAVNAGAPNLYAESAAQFLAAHLLSLHSPWSNPVSSVRNPGAISDRRLQRVLEFMRHHYAENLSLSQLAREAGISRFHFVNLFKKACGATPHQFLIELRLNRAAALLEDANLGHKEIAARCGYASGAHFAAAFQKHFSQTPAEYRKKFYDAE